MQGIAQGGAGVVSGMAVVRHSDQNLVALAFLFCALGDILLDLPEEKVPHGFQLGAISFAAGLGVRLHSELPETNARTPAAASLDNERRDRDFRVAMGVAQTSWR